MKSCLAQGFPFTFALKLYNSFHQAAKKGIITTPTISKHSQSAIGSQALLAVGYSDRSNAFIVRNSWGSSWGDKGYCYVPYEYMTDPNLCFDLWTIRRISNDSFGREYWHFDDIVNYLNENSVDNEEEQYLSDSEHELMWKDYRSRKNAFRYSWGEYRKDERGGSFTENDDDYIHQRYRRDRYDRDNELFDQRSAGYINSGFISSKSYPSPIYDRYEDEDRFYNDSAHDRFFNNHQNFMF
ncbi:unnamed protein product [Adineta ricciae]|uniref:Peptidase C1A papain C-terminal domain-containing protein n=1 Tax=Adineta ricciae TaxID=249248 RepID=A0A814AZ61_ADIRI|nr:unnamed protein product [Adineta ricciae]